jgi:hypothetical protein
VKLWTVQPARVVADLRRDGRLLVDESKFGGEVPPA